MEHGFDVIVHEIGHDEQMDELGQHEPIAHILREETHGGVGVELSVGEDPEDDEEDAGDGLGCHEVRGVGLNVPFLCGMWVTLFRNSTNWLKMAKVSRYCVKAQV